MQLPFLKNKSHPNASQAISPRSYLFAVEIGPEIVKTAIWSVINDKPQVLSVGRVCNWDDVSQDSLLEAVDQSLSQCSNQLDPSGKTKIEQVIFGLSPTWVIQDKINPDKLQLLKALSSKLELKPVGFVVTPEAVVKFLAHTENVPSTAILLGFWPHILEVTLVRMGRIDAIHHVKRSDTLTDDVTEGLSRFSHVDVLPSRILLYDSGLDLEDVKQTLLAFPWLAPQNKLPFLHFPKIEILSSDFTVRSIATAGGSEVAQALGLVVEPAVPDLGFSADAEPPAKVEEVAEVAELVIPVKNKITLPKVTMPKIKVSLIAVLLSTVALLGGLFATYWYLPKATVTLFVTPQNINTSFSFTATGRTLEVTVDASKTSPTTGSKLIGDKATGTVTIINFVGSPRQIPKGTILSLSSGLKFTTDQSASVSGATVDSSANLLSGKVTVPITASQIGSDSNLSAGSIFRVGTYINTETTARNDIAFSGGTSRQVQAASKDDIAKLRTDLSQTLKDKAHDQLIQQVSPQETIIPESITLSTVSEDLNHKDGEAGDDVTLKQTVKAKGIVVTKSDIQNMVDSKLKPLVPQGFAMPSESSQSFTVKKVDKTDISFDAKVTAKILPEYNSAEIRKNLAGKFPDTAKTYLETLEAVSQIDIVFDRKFPLLPATLPFVSQNINLSVRSSN